MKVLKIVLRLCIILIISLAFNNVLSLSAVSDSEKSFLRGDLDFNGIINIMDISSMKRDFIYDFSEDEILNGVVDINNNGNVDAMDVLLLSKRVLGVIDSFQFPYYYIQKETTEPIIDIELPAQPFDNVISAPREIQR